MAEVKSLEELCFTHIVMTLEEYTVDHLALLPKAFRERLLHTIPVVDVCRLEGTQFTKDLDMESIWEEVFKEYIETWPSRAKNSWRDEFFATLTRYILSNTRLYGHSYHYTMNFLVAMKSSHSNSNDKTVHEVTESEEMKPHSKVLQCRETCRAKQLVPPRYTKLIPEGYYNSFLPDSTALELISEKCHFRPKEISACVQDSNSLISGYNKGNLLREFFREVESLTLEGETKSYTSMKLFELVANLKLSDLTITGETIDSVAQTVRNLKYSALKRLTINTQQTLPRDSLFLITQGLTSLHTLSLSIEGDSHKIYDLDFSPHVDMALPWLQTCFKKPPIKHIHVRINQLATGSIIHVLAAFLSTHISTEQTLTITRQRSAVLSGPFYHSRTWHFDDEVTQHKSLEFDHKCYTMVFIDSSFALLSLQLKRLVINGGGFGSMACGHLSQLPNQLLMEELELASLDMRGFTESDYSTLLQKKILSKITFKDCSGVNAGHIRNAAFRTGFDLVVKDETCTLIRN